MEDTPTKLQTHVHSVMDYYDQSTKWYDRFYYDKNSLGIHYGFWETPETTKTEALINQYRLIQKLLKPEKGELILDAGCGVGGASLWLAEHTSARYIGITISEVQVAYANRFRARRKLEDRVNFYTRDYFSTGFGDAEFDKIFAIESFCYAYPNPLPLYQEMYRILKPGGILVISDGLYLRRPKGKEEEAIHADYCKGFKLLDLSTPKEIIDALQKAGFGNIEHIDKTKEIKKSIEDIDKRAKRLRPLRVFTRLGLATDIEADNLLAILNQKKMYDDGLFGYAVFGAEKPL